MVTRHRVNLSFSEQEYQFLSRIAESQGKLVTTMLTDIVKVMMYQSMHGGSKQPQEASGGRAGGDVPSVPEKRSRGLNKGSEGGE